MTRRSISSSEHTTNNIPSKRQNIISIQLTPIPGSPYASDTSTHSLASKHSSTSIRNESNRSLSIPKEQDLSRSAEQTPDYHSRPPESISRARSSYTSHRLQPPQSLDAALEILSSSPSDRGHGQKSITQDWAIASTSPGHSSDDTPVTPSRSRSSRDIPPSPSRPIPNTPISRPTVGGKGISGPILNHGIPHITDPSLYNFMSLLRSCNLTNEPREKSRYRKTSVGGTSCHYTKCIHGDHWIRVSLF